MEKPNAHCVQRRWGQRSRMSILLSGSNCDKNIMVVKSGQITSPTIYYPPPSQSRSKPSRADNNKMRAVNESYALKMNIIVS